MQIKKNDMVSINYLYYWNKNGYSQTAAIVQVNSKRYRVPAAYIDGSSMSKQAENDCYEYLGLKPTKYRSIYATHHIQSDVNRKGLNFDGMKPSDRNAANFKA